jgi:hypothetical protein
VKRGRVGGRLGDRGAVSGDRCRGDRCRGGGGIGSRSGVLDEL